MNQEKIGKFISKKRKEKNMTQTQLARKLGLSDRAISKWETGRGFPDPTLYIPLCNALNITLTELFNGEEVNTNEIHEEVLKSTISYTNNMINKVKKKNYVIIILSIILLIVICYISYRAIEISKYKFTMTVSEDEYNKKINALNNSVTNTIYKKTLYNNDYLNIDDIKIKNVFTDFIKVDKVNEFDSIKYYLYNEDGTTKASFWFSSSDTLTNQFCETMTYYNNDKKNKKGEYNKIDKQNFLLKKDINNDIDFLYYYMNNYNIDINLFTDITTIKENYALNSFFEIFLPNNLEKITFLSGDYLGYIYYLNNIKEVYIIRNNKRYIFTFIGNEYFTDKYINELISSIEII